MFFDDVFIRRVGSPIAQDYMMGVLAIILVMEATRRTMGNLLPAIGMACLLYALFGRYLPGVLAHRGYSVVRVVNHIYIGTEGIYGIAVGVVATYVFHSVLFGVLAQMTGLGRLFMDLATIVAGRFSGGPAKVCVVSSGLFGRISGSAIANAVTTGSLTIPLMKKYGFSPRFAGAVEASDLSRVGGKYDAQWHTAHFRDPRSLVPGSVMPPFPWIAKAPQELDAMVAYIQSLGRAKDWRPAHDYEQ